MMASKPSLTATPEKSTAEWAGVIKAIASAIASPCFISDPPLPEQMAGRARSTSVPVDVWAKQEQNQSQACWRGAMLSFVINPTSYTLPLDRSERRRVGKKGV